MNSPSEKFEKRAGNTTKPGLKTSWPSIKEKKYAAEFGVYLAGVTLLVAGFLALWIKAINVGGFWWIATAVLFVLGVILGEYLKRRIESLISLSRALRNQKQGD